MTETSITEHEAGASAFAGVRVIDANARVGGAYCAMILADHGAEVIKLELPESDPARGTPAFHVLNRGKQSIALDLRSETGSQALRKLAADADVFLYGWRPGDPDMAALDEAALRAANPSLVVGHLPAYGSKGPY